MWQRRNPEEQRSAVDAQCRRPHVPIPRPLPQDLFAKYVHITPEMKAVAMRWGWVLFVLLKAKLLPRFPDLVTCVAAPNVERAFLAGIDQHSEPGPPLLPAAIRNW